MKQHLWLNTRQQKSPKEGKNVPKTVLWSDMYSLNPLVNSVSCYHKRVVKQSLVFSLESREMCKGEGKQHGKMCVGNGCSKLG